MADATGGSLWGLVAVGALVAANGFFVAGEFALVKVRQTRVAQLVVEGRPGARATQQAVAHLDQYIAATQLGITLASLALGWIGEPALAGWIDAALLWLTGQSAHDLAEGLALGISFTLITGLHIILGELVPKSIALQRSETTALLVARPLVGFAWLFHPVIVVMNGIGNAVVRLLGLPPVGEHTSVHSVEELEMLVTQSGEAGVLDQAEEVLLHRIFDFGEKTAYQVMTPRTEIAGVPLGATLADVAHVVAQTHYTRIPVYEETLDQIRGVVHVKDLVPLLTRPDGAGQPVAPLLRPVLEIPETVSVEVLLQQMQSTRQHFAVIVDEYGGTAGIVTLEDILEEIVGEVEDEFDTRERRRAPKVIALPDGGSSVDGRLPLAECCARYGIGCEVSEYATLGGYVFGQLGRAPTVGDALDLGEYRLEVEAVDHLRIARVRIQLRTALSDTI